MTRSPHRFPCISEYLDTAAVESTLSLLRGLQTPWPDLGIGVQVEVKLHGGDEEIEGSFHRVQVTREAVARRIRFPGSCATVAFLFLRSAFEEDGMNAYPTS